MHLVQKAARLAEKNLAADGIHVSIDPTVPIAIFAPCLPAERPPKHTAQDWVGTAFEIAIGEIFQQWCSGLIEPVHK